MCSPPSRATSSSWPNRASALPGHPYSGRLARQHEHIQHRRARRRADEPRGRPSLPLPPPPTRPYSQQQVLPRVYAWLGVRQARRSVLCLLDTGAWTLFVTSSIAERFPAAWNLTQLLGLAVVSLQFTQRPAHPSLHQCHSRAHVHYSVQRGLQGQCHPWLQLDTFPLLGLMLQSSRASRHVLHRTRLFLRA